MTPLEDIQAAVLDAVAPLPVEPVDLGECLGLALAEPVVASHDIPPFANSAVDGYAVRMGDIATVPASLAVVDEVAAGSLPQRDVAAGVAVKVMTGAPLPGGTEAVVRVEDTDRVDGTVRILAGTAAGTAIRPAGGDVRAGAVVFEAGHTLGVADLGVLAALGVARPPVRRRPVVSIMSTGDEIVPPDVTELGPGMVRDANRVTLAALLQQVGAVVRDHGIVPDDAAALDAALDAAAGSDAIVSSGGVSMGDYDVVKERLTRRGTVQFVGVAIQPAKPLGFGHLDGVPFFGLPGNPVSVVVSFEQFVRPTLLAMAGAERIFRPRIPGILDEDVSTDPAKTVFLRVVTSIGADGRHHARSAGGQSSNVLSALAAADAFAVVPRGVAELAAGDEVTLEMFTLPASRTRAEAGL